MRWIDGQSLEPRLTTARQRLGAARETWIVDPPEMWLLGNTPFEREVAYGALLAEGLPASLIELLRSAALGGWVAGSPAFAAQVTLATTRPAQPRKRGRPRRAP